MPRNKVETSEPKGNGQFLATLQDMCDRPLVRLDEALRDLLAAVYDTGKSGELTFTLKLKPKVSKKDGEIRHIYTSAKIATKKPAEEHGESLFFIGPRLELSRNNVHQRELDFAIVDDAADDAAEVEIIDSPNTATSKKKA